MVQSTTHKSSQLNSCNGVFVFNISFSILKEKRAVNVLMNLF